MVNMRTQQEKNERQRLYRQRTNNGCTSKYEKTPNGFMMRMYRNMQSRVTGVQKKKVHLYGGKYLLDRQIFYDWAKSHKDFWQLYNQWIASGYTRRLTPTVDRVDSSKGYQLDNMEWVTHSENSRRGSLNRHNKLKI